jgi:hypothetical protein
MNTKERAFEVWTNPNDGQQLYVESVEGYGAVGGWYFLNNLDAIYKRLTGEVGFWVAYIHNAKSKGFLICYITRDGLKHIREVQQSGKYEINEEHREYPLA